MGTSMRGGGCQAWTVNWTLEYLLRWTVGNKRKRAVQSLHIHPEPARRGPVIPGQHLKQGVDWSEIEMATRGAKATPEYKLNSFSDNVADRGPLLQGGEEGGNEGNKFK